MQDRFTVTIWTKAPELGGQFVVDYSRRTQPVFTTNEFGFADGTISLEVSDFEAYQWYGRRNYWMRIEYHGVKVWEGRIEDMPLDPAETKGRQQLSLTAYGGIRAFADIPYTAAWSIVDLSGFTTINDQQMVARVPDKWTFDTNNRVYIAPEKGNTYATAGDLGSLSLRLPGSSARGITQISYTYRVNLPLNWTWRTTVLDDNFTNVVIVDSNVATGALQAGTKTLAPTGNKMRMNFEIFNNTGAPVNFAAESGTSFFEITNLRVMTSAGTTLYANEIISALISFVRTTNPNSLSPLTTGLQAPDVDLRNEVYLDMKPLDILSHLLAYGDTQGRRWEFAVWENLRCYYRPRGSAGRTWYIDSTPAIERQMDRLYNSVYAVYNDADGDDYRTATNTATDYVTLWGGLTRQIAINAQTDSATVAGQLRDVALLDGRSAGAIGEIPIARIFTQYGLPAPLWMVRSGDTIVLRTLPVLGQDINHVRSFIVAATSYDATQAPHVLTVSPEARVARFAAVEQRRQNALIGTSTGEKAA